MKGMSEREYAAHSRLSRGGVQKACKNGRLVVHDDGSINAAASDLRRVEMTDPDQQRRSLGSYGLVSGPGETTSYIKARTALTVYPLRHVVRSPLRSWRRWLQASGEGGASKARGSLHCAAGHGQAPWGLKRERAETRQPTAPPSSWDESRRGSRQAQPSGSRRAA